MAHSMADDHTNPIQQRTVLLATDSKNSVFAEVGAGRTNHVAYTAYGHQSAQQEVMTRLGFNGELREAKTSWYILGNGYRAYNPRLMRFHSPDSWSPFGGGGLNAYMYCVGDPVNRSDPTGHVPWIEPWLKRGVKNTFNFLFGGPDATGSREINRTAATAMYRLGGLQRGGTGDGKGLLGVGVAIAVGAPAKRTRGLYPPKGDGSTHGMKWGTTPTYVPSGTASSNSRISTSRSMQANGPRATSQSGNEETITGYIHSGPETLLGGNPKSIPPPYENPPPYLQAQANAAQHANLQAQASGRPPSPTWSLRSGDHSDWSSSSSGSSRASSPVQRHVQLVRRGDGSSAHGYF